MLAFRDFTIRKAVYPAGLRLPRHDHPWTNVTAVIRGEIVEETDAGERRGRSCSVVVKPAGTAHANRVVGRGAVTTVAIELHADSELACAAGKRDWSWFEDADAARVALALHDAMRGDDRDRIERAAQALLAFALTPQRSGSAPAWLLEVLTRIEHNAEEPLRFEEMARAIGLHPVYVSRAFRRYTGRTMSAYLQDVRLGRARHLLSTTARPLFAVAADCGFADASHLSRAFSRAHALTPGAFRQICNHAG